MRLRSALSFPAARTASLGLGLPCSAALLALACSAAPAQEPDAPPVVVTQPMLGEPAAATGPADAGTEEYAGMASSDGGQLGNLWGNRIDDPEGAPLNSDAGGGHMAVVTIVRSDSDGGAIGTGGSKGPPPPRVRTGQPSSEGNLPPGIISRIIRQNFAFFRQCYQKGLAKNPKLRGRISFRFVIEKDGSVRNVTSSGDLPDQDVNRCVARGIEKLQFPPPDPPGVVTVSYPIVFTP